MLKNREIGQSKSRKILKIEKSRCPETENSKKRKTGLKNFEIGKSKHQKIVKPKQREIGKLKIRKIV